MKVRDAVAADAEAVAAIYNHYILHTVVTFEEEPVSADEMARRMAAVQERYPWLVGETDGGIVGYAYASAWHARAAYRHSAESTVYLAPEATGRGYGTALYRELLDRLPTLGVRTVIGGVSLPNEASVAIHERFGFEQASHYREVGRKLGRWIDVGYWQLMLPSKDDPNEANPT